MLKLLTSAFVFSASFVYAFCFDSSCIYAQEFIPIASDPLVNEFNGSAFQKPDGQLCVVLSVYTDLEHSAAHLRQTCSSNFSFGAPVALFPEFDQWLYADNAYALTSQGRTQLYFNAMDNIDFIGYWGIADFDGEIFHSPTWLKHSEDLNGQPKPWSYPYLRQNGQVLLSYQIFDFAAGKNRVRFAQGVDRLDFSVAQEIAVGAQNLRFAEFADGTWAFVYQKGYGDKTTSYMTFSYDQGHTFTAPKPISGQINVRDPMPFQRQDGKLDVYYTIWRDNRSHAYRRMMGTNGEVGEEELLTAESLDIRVPRPFRLEDGRIFLILGQVTVDAAKVPHSDLVAKVLVGDALAAGEKPVAFGFK